MRAMMRATGNTIRRSEIELIDAAFAPRLVQTGADPVRAMPALAEPWRTELRRHLAQLAQSLCLDSPEMFADYLIWTRAVTPPTPGEPTELETQLRLLSQVLRDRLDAEAGALVVRWIEVAIHAVASTPVDVPVADAVTGRRIGASAMLAYQYTQALLRGDRLVASRLVIDAAGSGMAVGDIYLDVFQESQYTVGRLWEIGSVDVGQEHFCTNATGAVLAQMYPLLCDASQDEVGHSAVVASICGEQHALGARMVSDFFEMAGWSSYCIGADSPIEAIVSVLRSRQPDVLALSATVDALGARVRETIQTVRRLPDLAQVRIIVGGRVFQQAPDLWRMVGADGTGRDAREAVTTAMALTLARKQYA